MPQNQRQRLRMLVAQNLRQHTRADLSQFTERRGTGVKIQGIHDILGRFRIRVFDQQPLQRIAAAGNHVHAFHQRFMEFPQHLLHIFLGHRWQFHNGAGNIGYFLPIHAFEHVRGEFVTHGKQKYGNALLSRQFHPQSSTAAFGCAGLSRSPRRASTLFFLTETCRHCCDFF